MHGMELRAYLQKQPRGGIAALARQIDVLPVLVSQWSAEVNPRPVPLDHCAAIEAATGGAVSRRDLRPESWGRIWPELIGAGDPAPESNQAEAA